MTWNSMIRGVAIGDAYGNPNEFRNIGTLTKNDPRGPELPESLIITDDTQMTLALAEALDASREASVAETQDAIIKAFLGYYSDPDNDGKRAPGVTVMGSLAKLNRGTPWYQATSRTSDGSGTVMRTSPVAFVADDRWVGVAAFAAAVTHGTANAIAAAILNVAVLRAALRGEVEPGNTVALALAMASDPEQYGLLNVGEWLDDYPIDLKPGFDELSRLLSIAFLSLPNLLSDPWARNSDPSRLIGGGGWRAHETLVIALLAADMFPGDPWEALRRSVTTDGDSDTIGAVAGAILGALYPGYTWPDVLDRMEPRYARWIAESDDYRFAPAKRSWWQRLLQLQ